jgi:hypothetical protein
MTKRQEFCVYPKCSNEYNPNRTGALKLCVKHAEMLQFFLWALVNVKLPKAQDPNMTKSGLVIPTISNMEEVTNSILQESKGK